MIFWTVFTSVATNYDLHCNSKDRVEKQYVLEAILLGKICMQLRNSDLRLCPIAKKS